jgi:hypothetical protein
MTDGRSFSVWSLVKYPALITLGITFLRLYGELQHWPRPWFAMDPGGGGALVGISWLPVVFGPYFAVRLAAAGSRPSSVGRAAGFGLLGLALFFFAMWLFQSTLPHPSILTLLAFPLMLVAAFIPAFGWGDFGRTLLAYAFASRVPVLVVMYLAMRGNGGAGWGTHYDATLPMFAKLPFAKKYFYEALLPQMTLWVGWTVVVGAVLGAVAAAVALRKGRAAQPAT